MIKPGTKKLDFQLTLKYPKTFLNVKNISTKAEHASETTTLPKKKKLRFICTVN